MRFVKNLGPLLKKGVKYKVPKEFTIGGTAGISSFRDTKILSDNIALFDEYITNAGVRVLAEIGIHLLANTHPRVPYETGELRSSGRAVLIFGRGRGGYYKTVARGVSDGIYGSLDKVETIDFSELKGRVTKAKGIDKVLLNVFYTKTGEDGQDVAVFTHENIADYGAGTHPRARQPGTGPKYLERTYIENKADYISWIRDRFSYSKIRGDIIASMRVARRAKSRYEVDVTRLSHFVPRT